MEYVGCEELVEYVGCEELVEYVGCVCLARGGVGGKGGQWIRGLGLGFTNPVETGGVLDQNNICHHIIPMDNPPKKMKETLFTRHHRTVLPGLQSSIKKPSRKFTLYLYNHIFEIIQYCNVTDNEVYNNRPPPICLFCGVVP